MQELEALVEGKYDVVAKLREGGMGAIYKVRHRLLDEIRIIKVMRQGVFADAEMRRRFLEEAKTATRLKHPNICTIHDFAMDQEGTAYLVMEFIDGVTLGELLRSQGSPGLALSLEIVRQTLRALAYLHRKGVVHRDIAPDNLMLASDEDGDPRVKLIDLGIAKVLDRQSEMTSSGVFLGKVHYASPEQFGVLAHGETIDGRSDLYSLGLVLYELLTEKKAFAGDTPLQLMRAHVSQEPLPFSESDPKGRIPDAVQDAVLKALQKNREHRFQSAEEFSRKIDELLKNLPVSLEPGTGEELIKTVRLTRLPASDPVTPGVLDELNRPFLGKTTPAPSRPLELVADTLHATALLNQIAERELQRDLPGLQRILSECDPGSELERAVQNAINSVRRREEDEQARDEADWLQAIDAYSEAAWKRYLELHPHSERSEEARGRLEEVLAFQKVIEEDTVPPWESFLVRWPKGHFRQSAEDRLRELRTKAEKALEEAAWARAVASASEEGWRGYLAAHPSTQRSVEARNRLEEALEFQKVSQVDTAAAWQSFLSRSPEGAFQQRAGARLHEIQEETERRREEEDWARAEGENSVEAWTTFLAAHLESPRREQAQTGLAEATDYHRAQERNSLEEWQRFAVRWPKSRYCPEIAARVAAHREQKAYEEAVAAKTAQAFEHFLKAYPGARNRKIAEALLAETRRFEAARVAGQEALQEFLREFPEGIHGGEARRVAEELRQQSLLERIAEAEKAGELEVLRRLAGETPATSQLGEGAREAVDRLEKRQQKEREEADWRTAEGLDTSDAWRSFLTSHGRSARVPEARRRLRAAERLEDEQRRTARKEEKAWQRAESADTEKGWERFLAAYSSSKRGELAGEALSRLRAAAADVAEVTRRAAAEQAVLAEAVPAPQILQQVRVDSHLPGRRRRFGIRLAIASILAAAVVAGILYYNRPVPEPVPRGSLAVNVVPWARVVSVEDKAGKNLLAGREEFTPMSLDLAPGRYTIRLANPNFPGRDIALSAEVVRGKRTESTGRFEAIDVSSYFADQGWAK